MYEEMIKKDRIAKVLPPTKFISPFYENIKENNYLFREYDRQEKAGFPEELLLLIAKRLGIEKYHQKRRQERIPSFA